MMARAAVVCAVVLAAYAGGAHAQIIPQPGARTAPLGKDTLCFQYHFLPGDSLLFKVEANDSIAFGLAERYAKQRFEWLSVVCDSITQQGHYALHFEVLAAKEITVAYPAMDTVLRETSPWKGRLSYVVMDSLGHRLRTWVDDPQRAALTLGGAFQPVPIPTLDTSCGRQNQSWTVRDTTLWVENGVPSPAVRYQALVRVLDKADTLGMRFNQLQYTKSGIGRMLMPASAQTGAMTFDAVINAYGKLSLETSRRIPFHLFATSENKISITAGGRTKEGRHFITMNYHLMQLNSTDPSRRYIAQGE